MRLINTRTLEFEEFIGSQIPPYAILSHTWEDDEVSFKDMIDPAYTNKKGYRKIDMTCRLASEAGIDYAWVDTCCIDKSSSAELTEAINSMYQWYKDSVVCYAYLSDLPQSVYLEDHLPRCRWFSRGWTLQELIAPNSVQFFDNAWNMRGSKLDLEKQLSAITGISRLALQGTQVLSDLCVAQKMSWAARRETTRLEDTAYCLLGIFDVNMPLLYGEGKKAFHRLQEEIIRSTPDFSIFAWKIPRPPSSDSRNRIFCSVLAETPDAFADLGCLERVTHHPLREFSISNIGVRTNVPLWDFRNDNHRQQYFLPLDCSPAWHYVTSIVLRSCGPDHFVREDPYTLKEIKPHERGRIPREVYLLTKLPRTTLNLPSGGDMSSIIGYTRSGVLQVKVPESITVLEPWPLGRWECEDHIFFVSDDPMWDSCCFKFFVTGTTQLHQQPIRYSFKCMFLAVGWCASNLDSITCALVDADAFAEQLSHLNFQLLALTGNRLTFAQQLFNKGIPASRSVTFRISGRKITVAISYKLYRGRDRTVCRNDYWVAEFSHDTFNDEEGVY